jgi:hypothetical protein
MNILYIAKVIIFVYMALFLSMECYYSSDFTRCDMSLLFIAPLVLNTRLLTS